MATGLLSTRCPPTINGICIYWFVVSLFSDFGWCRCHFLYLMAFAQRSQWLTCKWFNFSRTISMNTIIATLIVSLCHANCCFMPLLPQLAEQFSLHHKPVHVVVFRLFPLFFLMVSKRKLTQLTELLFLLMGYLLSFTRIGLSLQCTLNWLADSLNEKLFYWFLATITTRHGTAHAPNRQLNTNKKKNDNNNNRLALVSDFSIRQLSLALCVEQFDRVFIWHTNNVILIN